jgi:hypothetical protein
MEAIEVTARFDSQGKITPLRFTWEGQDFPIESTGRRWEDGEGQHILAMLPGDKVVELVFIPAVGRWFLGRFGPDRPLA